MAPTHSPATPLAQSVAGSQIAEGADLKAFRTAHPVEAFDEDFAAATAKTKLLAEAGADQSIPTTGRTEALRTLRADVVQKFHRLARATYRTLKAMDNIADAATADLTPSDLRGARALTLAGLCDTLLDLAEPLTVAPAGSGPAPGLRFKLTPARLAQLDDLSERYRVAVGAPVTARSIRKARTEALPEQFRDVEELFAALDDAILQYLDEEDLTEVDETLAHRFIDAWFNARRVQDLGRRASQPLSSPTTAPKP